jgi:GGDEF domain-containing protein
VTAAVLSFADAVAKPDVTQARVIRLREHLRGGDLVGRLGDSEVGVLFHDAASRDARALRDRIHRVLEGDGVPLNQVSIGIASRNPGESTADSLTEEARQRAAQQTGDR